MSNETDSDESVPPEKLLIDDPSNFQFHAAYLTYSETFDKVTDPEIKKQLNHNITALQQDQIDYSAFYRNINQFREASLGRHSRALIKTQRKREWRRKAQRRARNKRHGK